MKKKIGDLTRIERKAICQKHHSASGCEINCPFLNMNRLNPVCMANERNLRYYKNREVEVEDNE